MTFLKTGQLVDKFKTIGLMPVAAPVVEAPLIAECYASLGCKVMDRTLITQYNFFIMEVVKAWIDPRRKRSRTIHHQGEGAFAVPGRTIKLPSPKTSILLPGRF